MTRRHERSHPRLAWLALALGLCAPGARAGDTDPPPTLSVGAAPSVEAPRHPLPRRSGPPREGAAAPESGGWWWLGTVGVAVALAAFGGLGLAGRRGLLPTRREAGPLEVVGRVGLSPRHTVYLLRAGDRVLLVGAGSQGPPALLGELGGLPRSGPADAAGGGA